MSAQAAAAKVTDQVATQTSPVLAKLAIFTACLGLAPITTYFLSQKYLWDGNATYAAITAIVAANLVLIAYIISSVREDARDQSAAAAAKGGLESRKDR
ncbi:hypothetical protein FRB99_007461 [Tulasnella sp. 403]|nr:hypothetical protein FRB99_007461 [Tulasnella sp. 403]